MICVRNLYKSYGNLNVLSNLSLDVEKGETLVIIGRSGVGKSVLLKHIIGLEKPDSGTITVNNTELTHLTGSALLQSIKDMGMLFQHGALFDSMTVGENTAFYLTQHGNPETNRAFKKTEIKQRVAEALEMVGLGGTENKMPSDLSGGMRKRAALARLIVYRPHILLYDEPTAGLDPITAMQINNLIRETKTELNATSIVVTHDLRSALEVGDKIALHHNGVLTHIASPKEFLRNQDPLVASFFNNVSIDQALQKIESKEQIQV